ncbi:hypothetical protein [Carnobacterium sp. ISL-102]|uniref:hypothetical protein n=1 Tax=Carnobacterium sp. ISL-102 TaxID=2819142 RepID=UPI001BEAF5E0|nr:hypothetical protein [Carnobacterium sp. ISL-102]MBT2731650.1 hypothetical protein [Carnobacterium sp. ISL-102]
MSEIKQHIDNSNRLADQLARDGGILDLGAIYAGAQRAEEERAENQRKIREVAAAAQAARDKELTGLLAKAGDKVRQDKEATAAKEIKEAKAKADKELEAKIRKQNGLNSTEEEAKKNAYRSMLNKIKK